MALSMEAARRIRNQSDDCILVFVTTSSEFAVESYDVNAAYYLLKPFQPEKLCQILDSFRLKEALHARYIEIISDRVPVRVPLHSILYADTFRNAVCLHTDAGPLRSYLTFHKFEEQIRDCHNFLSCYRGCMVNIIASRKPPTTDSFWITEKLSRSGNVVLPLSEKLIFSIFFVRRRKISALKIPLWF